MAARRLIQSATPPPMLDFTLRLYKGVVDEDKNVFLSPFSIQAALCLASLGAKGDTELEVRRALGVEHLSSTELHQRYKEIHAAVNTQSEGSTTLEIANKMFARLNLDVSDDYKADAVAYYGSGLEVLDFVGDAEGSRQKINNWVEAQTRDKIKGFLPEGTIRPDTLIMLVNAIYFKGSWAMPFETTATKDKSFNISKSTTVNVQMMHDTRYARCASDPDLGCSVAALPYRQGSVHMIFIRPDEIDGLEQLEKRLTAAKFAALLRSLDNCYGPTKLRFGIPKFKMSVTFDLVPVLAALGISSMFDCSKADFSRMLPSNPEAVVSGVVHTAFVEVNESGTEAAAANRIHWLCLPEDFILDRPFLFVIQDNASKSILFMGRYRKPE